MYGNVPKAVPAVAFLVLGNAVVRRHSVFDVMPDEIDLGLKGSSYLLIGVEGIRTCL